MIIRCPYCGKDSEVRTGAVNRARKLGVPIYCNRVCAGLGRRVDRTPEEWKEMKRLYDIERRKDPVLRMYRLLQSYAYNESPVGRTMQKRNREKFKQSHLEYCRTKEYREWKKTYDETHQAKKKYGEFWESAITLKHIEKFLIPEKYQIKLDNGVFNKSQKRKRQWNSLQRTLKKHYGRP